jgi:hypothetical protein
MMSLLLSTQMVLKVSAPPDLGVADRAGLLDRSMLRQDAWHPGSDSFAQVGPYYHANCSRTLYLILDRTSQQHLELSELSGHV